MTKTVSEVVDLLVKFRNDRDWAQFHNPKDLAIALSIESNELLETFLWKSPETVDPEKVKDELADVLAYALLIMNHYQLDFGQIISEKIEKNAQKYPVEKSKGVATKYNEL